MAIFCRQHTKPTANERAFCQALLNNENPSFAISKEEDDDVAKIRKKGFYLPPDDFVYGLKHPKQNGITGVAAALQHYDIPIKTPKSITIPDFIAINKAAARLGLTKVRDIHQYRKTMTNHQIQPNPCYCPCNEKQSIADVIIHGRTTGEEQSIRDLIENKYLHEWLHKTAIRRCKEILANNTSKQKTKACLFKQNSNNKKNKLIPSEINKI